jgi:flagellar protein FlaG
MQTPQPAPVVQLEETADYREGYANSVQLRASLWDFLLLFGTLKQQTPERVTIQNFQGVYLSPQQAKALLNVLQQNISQYESTFGEIRLEPKGDSSLIQ